MTPRRLAPVVALATASLAVLAGCSSAPGGTASDGGSASGDGGKVRIVAATNVYGDIATTIGGSDVQVTSVIDDPDKDPHEYEADARTQLAIAKADILIENGGGYDDFMDTMRSASKNTDATVIDAVKVSGRDASVDGFNEHVWYDYPTVKKVVSRLSDAIGKADAGARSAVQKRADALLSEIDGLIGDEEKAKSEVSGKGVAITEPVPLYMLEAIGADDKTPEAFSEAVEEGTDVPASVLQDTLALFSEKRVAALVYNAQTGGPQTDAVLGAAKKAGIPAVPVTETLPNGAHYVEWQKGILDKTVAALRGGA